MFNISENISDCGSQDYFSGLMDNHGSKILSVVISILGSWIGAVFCYSVIWYQKFGSDENQTLLNRIYTGCWWCALIWLMTVQQIDIIRFLFGPLPMLLCRFNDFVKLIITTQLIVHLDTVILLRYVLIFWIKNPTGIDDGFWTAFLNWWIFIFSLGLQLVIHIMPGKDSPDVWICSGILPNTDLEYRNVWGNHFLKIVSFLLHLAVAIKINSYKLKIAKENAHYHPRSKEFWLLSLNRNSVFDIFESVIPFILILFAILLNIPRREMNLEKINSYPLYLGEYLYTLIRPIVLVILTFVSRITFDKHLRNTLSMEIKSFY
jgi:hypothetical protein